MLNAFEAARTRLTAEVTSGRLAPGAALPVVPVAQALKLSPTPVREALAYLAGQGLIESHRGRGYCVRRLDAESLAELYDLHQLQILGALARQPPAAAATRPASDDAGAGLVICTAGAIFARIVEAAGNAALVATHQVTTLRLAAARRVEPLALGDPAPETARLVELFRSGDQSMLRSAVRAYHRRRTVAARAIVVHLRSAATRGEEISGI